MPIANCKRCGRIYNRIGRDICTNCIKEEDHMLNEIRQFLRKHKDATIIEVTEGTGVEYNVIVQLIRDGRLLLRDNPNMTYPCERCDKPTASGRFCSKCSSELAQTFDTASATMKDRNKPTTDGRGFFSRN